MIFLKIIKNIQFINRFKYLNNNLLYYKNKNDSIFFNIESFSINNIFKNFHIINLLINFS